MWAMILSLLFFSTKLFAQSYFYSFENTYSGKLVGKRASVVDIGKHFGMFKDIVEGNIQHQNLHKVYVVPAFSDDNVDSKG